MKAIGTTGAAEGMARHAEQYEEFGEVTVFLTDLAAAWQAQAERRRRIVARDEAAGYTSVFLPVTPWIAWAYITDGDVKRRMYDVETHERTDGRVRLDVGASFHCKHDLGDIDYLVVDVKAPRYYTNEYRAGDVTTVSTVQIVPADGGIEVRFLTALAHGDEGVLPFLQAAAERSARVLSEIITADIEAGVISPERIASTEAGKQGAMRPGVAEGRFGGLHPGEVG